MAKSARADSRHRRRSSCHWAWGEGSGLHVNAWHEGAPSGASGRPEM
ncbi:hypothetical protein [uncultured Prevotella sp.]|nr:hypothetical protein [uncultured Prevotella sp.]